MRRLVLAGLVLGACGGDEDVPPLTAKQEELTTAAEACLRRAACLGRDEDDLGACIRSFTTEAGVSGREGVLACTKGAGSNCDALLACLNAGEPAAACAEPYALSCTDASPPVFRSCESGREVASVCTQGTTCNATGVPHRPCGIASCNEIMTAPMCEVGTGRRLTCEVAVLVPRPCGEGLICEDGQCSGKGEPCNVAGGMRCDGTLLTYCAMHRQATRDCAATGHVCGTVNGEAACTASACVDRGLTASCTGTTLTLCDDGLAYSFECGKNGYRCCGHQGKRGGNRNARRSASSGSESASRG